MLLILSPQTDLLMLLLLVEMHVQQTFKLDLEQQQALVIVHYLEQIFSTLGIMTTKVKLHFWHLN